VIEFTKDISPAEMEAFKKSFEDTQKRLGGQL
jgi:hypothetical protein